MRYTHITITAYGFWLPNDPRGSGSRIVRAQHLYEAGGAEVAVEGQGLGQSLPAHEREAGGVHEGVDPLVVAS